MALEIGALRALLSLDSTAFERGARRAEASMGQLQRRLHRLGRGMRDFGRGMSLRVTAPLVGAAGLAVRSSLQIVDSQAKLAESLDTSVVSIQNLTRAAELSGISQGDLEGSLTRMTRRISLAEQGAGPAAAALERLGLSAENLNDLPVDQRVDRITSAIRRLIPEAEQAGVASQVFGDRSGLAIMRLNSDVIARATEEVERFGVAISETDADQIEATNDAMSAMGLVTRGLANQLTAALAPTLQSIAERMADVAVWFKGLSPEMRRFGAIAATAAVAIGPLAIGIGFMATGFAALASPIGLVIFALGAAAGAAAYVVTQWDDLAERFPILQSAADFGSRIAEAWSNLPDIKWALLIPALRWARFIPGLRWAAFIPRLAWSALITPLAWTARLIPAIGWGALAGSLSWGALIKPLVWTARLIPGIGWALMAGQLAWSALVDRIEWNGWIPTIHWASWIPRINWLDWIPSVDWDRVFNASGAEQAAERAATRSSQVMRDHMDGLREGIAAEVGDLGDAAAGIAEYMEDRMREEGETQSPSRAWMRIGQDLMAGLGIGLSNGVDGAVGIAQGAAESLTGALSGFSGTFDRIGDSFKTVLEGMLFRGQSFRDSMSGILSSLSTQLFSSGFDGIWGAITGALFPNANGNAFSGGRVIPFADGGVVTGPTLFPMAGRSTGLMGEAGAEAIMPLKRGADGKLGVASSGGGKSITMNMNIDARGADPSVVPRIEQALAQIGPMIDARLRHPDIRYGG